MKRQFWGYPPPVLSPRPLEVSLQQRLLLLLLLLLLRRLLLLLLRRLLLLQQSLWTDKT